MTAGPQSVLKPEEKLLLVPPVQAIASAACQVLMRILRCTEYLETAHHSAAISWTIDKNYRPKLRGSQPQYRRDTWTITRSRDPGEHVWSLLRSFLPRLPHPSRRFVRLWNLSQCSRAIIGSGRATAERRHASLPHGKTGLSPCHAISNVNAQTETTSSKTVLRGRCPDALNRHADNVRAAGKTTIANASATLMHRYHENTPPSR